MKFDLHRLRLLRELAHRGTIASVAEALSYSTSSVSQQLAVLETEVGTPLLVADGRRVRLTPQAEILVEHTEIVLKQLEQAETDIAASLDSVVGTVRLATVQTAALFCVPQMLTELSARYPALHVRVTQAEPEVALSGLLAREFDLVCDEAFPDLILPQTSDTHVDPVGEDPMRVAFLEVPSNKSVDDTELADFADSAWVMEMPGSPGREWAVATCRRAGFEPRIVHQTSDGVVQAALVAQGQAVAFLPDLLWHDRRPQFHLRWMEASHVRTLVTTCRAGLRGHPNIKLVRDVFRQTMQATRS